MIELLSKIMNELGVNLVFSCICIFACNKHSIVNKDNVQDQHKTFQIASLLPAAGVTT